MDSADFKLLLKYPLISVQKDENFKLYSGYLLLDGKDYKIKFKKYYSSNKFELEETEESITNIKDSVNLQNPTDVVAFLDGIYTLLSSKVSKSENFSDVYRKVLHEYYEFTNFFLTLKNCELSKDLSVIKVSMLDDKNRLHYVEISIDFREPKKLFTLSKYDIPRKTLTSSFRPNTSLVELFDEFAAAVVVLQSYFDFMDSIDLSSYVLDPESPKRADSYRRIYLDENLSVVITVDPFNIHSRPALKFLGPDRLVEEYRMKLNDNLKNWKEGTDVLENILNMLGIESFPQKQSSSTSNSHILKDVGDCAICFTARYNDKLPEIICENKSCENAYHNECLYEWLVTTSYKKLFLDIYGQCPICEKSISCSVPSFIN